MVNMINMCSYLRMTSPSESVSLDTFPVPKLSTRPVLRYDQPAYLNIKGYRLRLRMSSPSAMLKMRMSSHSVPSLPYLLGVRSSPVSAYSPELDSRLAAPARCVEPAGAFAGPLLFAIMHGAPDFPSLDKHNEGRCTGSGATVLVYFEKYHPAWILDSG